MRNEKLSPKGKFNREGSSIRRQKEFRMELDGSELNSLRSRRRNRKTQQQDREKSSRRGSAKSNKRSSLSSNTPRQALAESQRLSCSRRSRDKGAEPRGWGGLSADKGADLSLGCPKTVGNAVSNMGKKPDRAQSPSFWGNLWASG